MQKPCPRPDGGAAPTRGHVFRYCPRQVKAGRAVEVALSQRFGSSTRDRPTRPLRGLFPDEGIIAPARSRRWYRRRQFADPYRGVSLQPDAGRLRSGPNGLVDAGRTDTRSSFPVAERFLVWRVVAARPPRTASSPSGSTPRLVQSPGMPVRLVAVLIRPAPPGGADDPGPAGTAADEAGTAAGACPAGPASCNASKSTSARS